MKHSIPVKILNIQESGTLTLEKQNTKSPTSPDTRTLQKLEPNHESLLSFKPMWVSTLNELETGKAPRRRIINIIAKNRLSGDVDVYFVDLDHYGHFTTNQNKPENTDNKNEIFHFFTHSPDPTPLKNIKIVPIKNIKQEFETYERKILHVFLNPKTKPIDPMFIKNFLSNLDLDEAKFEIILENKDVYYERFLVTENAEMVLNGQNLSRIFEVFRRPEKIDVGPNVKAPMERISESAIDHVLGRPKSPSTQNKNTRNPETSHKSHYEYNYKPAYKPRKPILDLDSSVNSLTGLKTFKITEISEKIKNFLPPVPGQQVPLDLKRKEYTNEAEIVTAATIDKNVVKAYLANTSSPLKKFKPQVPSRPSKSRPSKSYPKYEKFVNMFVINEERARVTDVLIDTENNEIVEVTYSLIDRHFSNKIDLREKTSTSNLHQIPENHQLAMIRPKIVNLDEDATDKLKGGVTCAVYIDFSGFDDYKWPEYKILKFLREPKEMFQMRNKLPTEKDRELKMYKGSKSNGTPDRRNSVDAGNSSINSSVLAFKPRSLNNSLNESTNSQKKRVAATSNSPSKELSKPEPKRVHEEKPSGHSDVSVVSSKLSRGGLSRGTGRRGSIGLTSRVSAQVTSTPESKPQSQKVGKELYKMPACLPLENPTKTKIKSAICNFTSFPQVTLLPDTNQHRLAYNLLKDLDEHTALQSPSIPAENTELKAHHIYGYRNPASSAPEKSLTYQADPKIVRVEVLSKTTEKTGIECEIRMIDGFEIPNKTVKIDSIYHLKEKIAQIPIATWICEFENCDSVLKVLENTLSTENLELNLDPKTPRNITVPNYAIACFIKKPVGLEGPTVKNNLDFFKKDMMKLPNEWHSVQAFITGIFTQHNLKLSKTNGLHDAMMNNKDKLRPFNLITDELVVGKMYGIQSNDETTPLERVVVVKNRASNNSAACQIQYVDTQEKSSHDALKQELIVLTEELSIKNFPNDTIEVIHTPDLLVRYDSLNEAMAATCELNTIKKVNIRYEQKDDLNSIVCDFEPDLIESKGLNLNYNFLKSTIEHKGQCQAKILSNTSVRIIDTSNNNNSEKDISALKDLLVTDSKLTRKHFNIKKNLKYARTGQPVVITNQDNHLERAVCVKESNVFYCVDSGIVVRDYLG